MAIPVSYSLRNLRARALTTALTATGMALVVFVFAAVLMLAKGLEETLVATGSPDNVIAIRKGAQTEIQSSVERSQADIVTSMAGLALGTDGRPLATRETLVLVNLPKRDSDAVNNVTVRGVEAASYVLRPGVRVLEGRAPRPGSSEIMVGSAIAKGFRGTRIGDVVRFGGREWTVAGTFDAGTTGFASEIWADGDQLMQAFRRPAYSVLVAKLADRSTFENFKARVAADPRLTNEVKIETVFYEEQSKVLATFLRIVGLSMTVIFSVGAMLGAMITMYSSVAGRTAEIGTLRAIGFGRWEILWAFLLESALLGLVGGLVGLGLAACMRYVTVSTVNFQTFSELAFSFTLTPAIAASALAFSMAMGFVGGFLPAVRAARLNIVAALRG